MKRNHIPFQREHHARQPTDVGAPVIVWDCPGLTLFEACLWANIKSLSQGPRGCFASNAYLCKIMRGASERHISRSLTRLEAAALIRIRTEYDPAAIGSHRRTIRVRYPWAEEPVPEGWTLVSTPPPEDQPTEGGGLPCLPMGRHQSPPWVDSDVYQSGTEYCVPDSSRVAVEEKLSMSNNNNSAHAPLCTDAESCVLPDAVVVAPHEQTPTPDSEPPLSDSAALLHATGLFRRAVAAHLAAGWQADWLAAWIEESKKPGVASQGGFLRGILCAPERIPPESYIKRQQRRIEPRLVSVTCACGWSGTIQTPPDRPDPTECRDCRRARSTP